MTDTTPSWVRNAKAGDLVVCISVDPDNPSSLTKGRVHTFMSAVRVPDWARHCRTGNTITYPVGISVNGVLEICNPKRFKPLQTTKSTSKAVAEIKRLSGVSGKLEQEVDA